MPTNLPTAEYTKEIRFAVVMYGGVSLAIYINGVAQELFRMVRSTAENVERDGIKMPLSGAPDAPPKSALKGTERVYRKLSLLLSDPTLLEECRQLADLPQVAGEKSALMKRLDALINNDEKPVNTRFVVDILSGTSAGGINAIYLAKAFANDQNIDQLKDLWVNEGDISLLLNDKRSVMGLHLRNQSSPQSLLNSRRMYFKLLKSLEDMEEQHPSNKNFDSPYVDELDLFITATDIEGVPVPLRLSDSVVFERRHRSVFHLRYGKAEVVGADFNDFLHAFNPFLAFAARCTSSFPFAFEPMRLSDITEVLSLFHQYRSFDPRKAEEQWKRYFFEELDPRTGFPIEPPRFSNRSFGDGGYLDNKPFSYATETLAHRTADVPIDRKLIYIEPSPEHPEDEPTKFEKINALQNVKAAILDLPTYETIREDLQRVLERNQLISRVNRIVSRIEKDLNESIPEGVRDFLWRREVEEKMASEAEEAADSMPATEAEPDEPPATEFPSREQLEQPDPLAEAHTPSDWALMDLTEMVRKNSRYYLPYRRLRIASVTDGIARLVARLANFDEKSDQFLAIRALVRVWRDENFVDYANESAELGTINRFLWSFDFDYRQRRLSFARMKVDELSGFGKTLVKELEDLIRGSKELVDLDLSEAVKDTFPQIRLQEYGLRLLDYVAPLNEDQLNDKSGTSDPERQINPERLKELQIVTRVIKAELNEISKGLRTWGRWLRARQGRPRKTAEKPGEPNPLVPNEESPSPLLEIIKEIKLTPDDLTYILGMTRDNQSSVSYALDEDDHVARTQQLLDREDKANIRTLLARAAASLRHHLEIAFYQTRLLTYPLFSPEFDYKPVCTRGQELDAENRGLLQSEIAEIARGYLSYYYNQFEDYDQIRFPIMYETDYGEADVVEVIRISPEDATGLINERNEFRKSAEPGKARQKLAGISLHHFGAFLDRTWRQNDIMWGRLDGAERLISGLLPAKAHEKVRAELFREAQLAIILEELKPEGMKQFQGVISEALMRAGSGLSINDAIGKTLQPLEESPIKTRLEAMMKSSLTDDELMKFMSEGYEVNRQLDPKAMLNSMSRATQIIGKMFEDLADASGFEGKRLAWIARMGKIFWGLVEVAVPNSLLNLLMFHWLKILYFFEVLLIIGSVLLNSKETQNFGLKALGFTLAVNIIVLLLRDIMKIRRWWQTLLIIALSVVTVILAAIGAYALYQLGPVGIINRIATLGRELWTRPANQ